MPGCMLLLLMIWHQEKELLSMFSEILKEYDYNTVQLMLEEDTILIMLGERREHLSWNGYS